jgi:ketosteroid isomerase-like protein
MSQENVDLVRRTYDAFNRRDLAVIVSGMHPDVELQTTVETHYGHHGVADWIGRADEVFDSLSMTVEEVLDLDDHVVAVIHERAGGKGSGLEIDQHFTHIWTFRDGRVLRFQAFTERAAALEALGLSE